MKGAYMTESSKQFREDMAMLCNKIIESKEKLEPHQWIAIRGILADFEEILTEYIKAE